MTRVYDLAMTHQLDSDDLFIHRIQAACAAAQLNFFLIEPLWAEPFLHALQQGRVHTRVLLNMHSEHHQPQDLYHQLVLAAHHAGAHVIDPPDLAQAAFDKCRLHPRLLAAHLPVPFSLIVNPHNPPPNPLPDADRLALGSPFVIKPAMGYGRRGLVLDATDLTDLARSQQGFPDNFYLFQRRIQPGLTPEGEPLYFRVFYAFETTWIAWWNCHTDHYRLPTPHEIDLFQLPRLHTLSRQLAALTGLRFFSSEIALLPDGQPVLIDYVNDQCHMLSQSADPQKGVPDELVLAIADRLVEGAGALIHNHPDRAATLAP